jgi:hypothetical protein
VNEILFDPLAGPISVNVKMMGVVFITYHLTYWSDKKPQRKILMEMRGNNDQDHDDSCTLSNMDDPQEPPSNYKNRSITIEGFIRSTTKEKTPYQLFVEFVQNGKIIDSKTLFTEGELSKADGAQIFYEAGKLICP